MPLLCFGFLLSFNLVSAFDIGSLLGDVVGGKKRGAVGILLTDIEHRRKQLENLENDKEVFEKRTEESIDTINKILNNLKENIRETKEKIKSATGSYEELLKKKLPWANPANMIEIDVNISAETIKTKETLEVLLDDY